MRYVGAKGLLSKRIAQFICENKQDAQLYFEPFCGTAAVAAELADCFNHRFCSDLNEDVILLHLAIQQGWTPPAFVSKSQYLRLKSSVEPSALRAFAGCFLSFGGIWFGSYSHYTTERNGKLRNFALDAKRVLLRNKPKLQDARFSVCDYRALAIPSGSVVYCDPPYVVGQTYYKGAVNRFDTAEFWQIVRRWSERCSVFVSEYEAPSDFACVAEWPLRTSLHRKTEAKPLGLERKEMLFSYNPKWD